MPIRQRNLGGSTVIPAGVLNQPQFAFTRIIDFRMEDEEARPITITCGQSYDIDLAASTQMEYLTRVNDIVPVVGLVKWGNDGFQLAAEFDCAFGTTFTVSASYISVDLSPDVTAAGPLAIDAQTTIGVFASFEPSPVRGYLQRTRRAVAPIANGEARQFPIPPFAKRFIVDRQSVIPSAPAINIFGVGTFEATIFRHVANNDACPWIEIPNDTDFVEVVNVSLDNISAIRVVFELNLS